MIRGILITSILIFSFIASAQNRQELEKEKEETLREIQISKELLEKTTTQKKNTIRRVSILNRGIRSRETLIRTIENEIEEIENEMLSIEMEIRSTERTVNNGKEEYAAIIYGIYRSHTDYDKMMYLLASESINQFYQRIKYMRYLTSYREKKILELESLIKDLERMNEELSAARDIKLSLLDQKENESRNLSRERNQRNNMIQQLSQDERRLRQKLAEKERIRNELENEIRKAIEEEARKRNTNDIYSTLTPEQKLNGRNFAQNKGSLPWPVDRGIITAEFGLINHPVLRGVKIMNNGVDISSAPNTKARAVFDGEVTKIVAILGANYTVLIMHGEYLSVYQNVVDLKVKAGDKISVKQDIGTIYTDQEENMAVLHFQIWKSKEILDPAKWLSK
ncbi:murein hydrolase activator EnvC family protein [Bacteroidota bacterium]